MSCKAYYCLFGGGAGAAGFITILPDLGRVMTSMTTSIAEFLPGKKKMINMQLLPYGFKTASITVIVLMSMTLTGRVQTQDLFFQFGGYNPSLHCFRDSSDGRSTVVATITYSLSSGSASKFSSLKREKSIIPKTT